MEQEKLELEKRLQESKDSFANLQSENSTLSNSVKELNNYKSQVTSLEEKIASLELEAAKKSESHNG